MPLASHQGKLWIEQAERILAGMRLLGVANGEEPDEAKSIKIFPLDRIPSRLAIFGFCAGEILGFGSDFVKIHTESRATLLTSALLTSCTLHTEI